MLQDTIAFTLALLALALPAELMAGAPETLASVTYESAKQPGSKFIVSKTLASDGVHIEMRDGTGRVVWTSPSLGTADKLFTADARASRLALVDVTGDGVPEVVTAATSPPRSALLHVFRLDAAQTELRPIPCVFPADGTSRDAFVTDLAQEDGQDLTILADRRIQTLGRTYGSAGIRKPGAGIYVFGFREGAFRLQSVREIPRGP